MNWTLKTITQETHHKFLNFFTYSFVVEKEGETADYPYYVSSRHNKDELLALTHRFSRPDGVLIAAIKEGDEPSVLIIEEFRPPLNAKVIEFPAGLLEPTDENETVAAMRESIEEAGVELCDVTLLCPPSPTSAGLSDEMISVVYGKVKRLTDTHLEKFEDIHARFLPIRDIPALLADPNALIAINARLCLLYIQELFRNKK